MKLLLAEDEFAMADAVKQQADNPRNSVELRLVMPYKQLPLLTIGGSGEEYVL